MALMIIQMMVILQFITVDQGRLIFMLDKKKYGSHF